jgi:hypothetical protein
MVLVLFQVGTQACVFSNVLDFSTTPVRCCFVCTALCFPHVQNVSCFALFTRSSLPCLHVYYLWPQRVPLASSATDVRPALQSRLPASNFAGAVLAKCRCSKQADRYVLLCVCVLVCLCVRMCVCVCARACVRRCRGLFPSDGFGFVWHKTKKYRSVSVAVHRSMFHAEWIVCRCPSPLFHQLLLHQLCQWRCSGISTCHRRFTRVRGSGSLVCFLLVHAPPSVSPVPPTLTRHVRS